MTPDAAVTWSGGRPLTQGCPDPAAPHGSAYSDVLCQALMSFVKHRGHDWNVLHARQREVD